MTTYNKTSLKTYFENLDVPSGTDYANLIDSQVNLVETTQQSMAGPLYATEILTPKVSASNANIVGTMSAGTVNANTLQAANATFSGTFSAASVNTATVSADVVYASAVNSQKGLIGSVLIVSAAGTTQATGGAMTLAYITRGQGITDGAATGYTLTTPVPGYKQYLSHEGAASANLWPTTDCKINALATNAAYGMAANTLYTIAHITNKLYMVK